MEKPGSAATSVGASLGRSNLPGPGIHVVQAQPADARIAGVGDPDRDPIAGSHPSGRRIRRWRSRPPRGRLAARCPGSSPRGRYQSRSSSVPVSGVQVAPSAAVRERPRPTDRAAAGRIDDRTPHVSGRGLLARPGIDADGDGHRGVLPGPDDQGPARDELVAVPRGEDRVPVGRDRACRRVTDLPDVDVGAARPVLGLGGEREPGTVSGEGRRFADEVDVAGDGDARGDRR